MPKLPSHTVAGLLQTIVDEELKDMRKAANVPIMERGSYASDYGRLRAHLTCAAEIIERKLTRAIEWAQEDARHP